jgi:hypothetical protein
MKASKFKVEMQITVRDKDGNIKYQGPLVMDAVHEEKKDQANGGDSSHSSSHGDR